MTTTATVWHRKADGHLNIHSDTIEHVTSFEWKDGVFVIISEGMKRFTFYPIVNLHSVTIHKA